MEDVRRVSVFGVTGSVGQSTADVIMHSRDKFEVVHVTANNNADALADAAIRLKAQNAVLACETNISILQDRLKGTGITAQCGEEALLEAASEKVDIVMAAIVGLAGLEPLLKSIENAKAVAIANKEPLVSAGALVMEKAKAHGTLILPVDSEHNAIFQVFDQSQRQTIKRILLTASGGPFRTWSKQQMKEATPAQAVAHPNWSMGQKISVDSATLMNKALEVIEAHFLYAMPADQIHVVVHPQSLIHSMVEYCDGSVLSQMGASDMRTPIACCLGWPQRLETSGARLNLTQALQFNFEPLDHDKFPSVGLAYDALAKGNASCIGFNAANEVAVQAFLNERIGFLEIIKYVESGLNWVDQNVTTKKTSYSLEEITTLDQTVREYINSVL
jgi:1-deoxy-D-xylulose-5-phosphate reductoisomerase